MEFNLGDTVYFAKNHHDFPRDGVIVRNEGTFYVGVQPPTDVNVVKGRIEPRPGDFRFPIYNYFMNFKKEEVWACKNETENNEKAIQSLEKSIKPSFNTIQLDTPEDARVLYKAFRKENIDCMIEGCTLTNITNMTRAEKLYESFLSRHGKTQDNRKRSLRYEERPKHSKNDEIDLHFEI